MEKTRVCVTGGSGYLGSWLVKKLLHKGYIVHATLRSLDEKSKVGLLKSLPNANTGLVLFKADIYDPNDFQAAIEGCNYVLHLATPLQHNTKSSLYKDTREAAIAGVKTIADCCLKSQSVKKLIYTSSVMASSPLKDDGSGFESYWDESCWTTINDTPFTYFFNYPCICNCVLKAYTMSKTSAEKEILSYNATASDPDTGLEVVSLVCGLVGGDTILSYLPASMSTIISPLFGDSLNSYYQSLQHLQELLGCVPLVHIEDVCEAHVLCMEKPSLKGRFICSNADPTAKEITEYFKNNNPNSELEILDDCSIIGERGSRCSSIELIKLGFEHKFNMADILDGSVHCGKMLGSLPNK
ncbi:NADPH HC-toxin reductase 1-like [Daucus carota subsp. sativus]|uniref:NADPH HC-toxin reductase 1-like n=1 Tax=Daucus carota subsp. sativus TaxID=79200 RepID=UPI003082AA25